MMKRISVTVEQFVRDQGLTVTNVDGIHTYGLTPNGARFRLSEAGCDGYFCLTIKKESGEEIRKSRLLISTAIKQIKNN